MKSSQNLVAILLGAGALLSQSATLAQQQPPVNTSELTVTAGTGPSLGSLPGTAKVVAGSETAPTTISPNIATPKGVYSAGNPVLGHCLESEPCETKQLSQMTRSQLLLLGKTVDGPASEHAFRQEFIVDNGGQYIYTGGGGKEGLDTFTRVKPTAGMGPNQTNAPAVWSMNSNLILDPDVRTHFAIGFEQDLGNFSGVDCGIKNLTGHCHVAWLAAQGFNRSTTGLLISGDGGTEVGLDIHERGQRHAGRDPNFDPRFASEADIRIRDSAPVGILFTKPVIWNNQEVRRTIATIQDNSSAPTAIDAAGNYTGPVFNARTNGTTGFVSSGTKTGADFLVDNTNSPGAFVVTGSHSGGAIQENSATPSSLQTTGTKTTATLNLLDAAPAALRMAGSHSVGVSFKDDSVVEVLSMRQGQTFCWNANACVYWTPGDGYLFKNELGQNIGRLDNGGDLWLKGQVREFIPQGGGL